jgi:hypothetical protein
MKEPTAAGAMRDAAAALVAAVAVAEAVAVAVWLSAEGKCVRMHDSGFLVGETLPVEVVFGSGLTSVTLNWGDWARIPVFVGPVLTKLTW